MPAAPARSGATACSARRTPGRVRNPVWYALVTRAEHAEHEAVDDVQKAVPGLAAQYPG